MVSGAHNVSSCATVKLQTRHVTHQLGVRRVKVVSKEEIVLQTSTSATRTRAIHTAPVRTRRARSDVTAKPATHRAVRPRARVYAGIVSL